MQLQKLFKKHDLQKLFKKHDLTYFKIISESKRFDKFPISYTTAWRLVNHGHKHIKVYNILKFIKAFNGLVPKKNHLKLNDFLT